MQFLKKVVLLGNNVVTKLLCPEKKGDDVLLLPIKAINEAFELHELKKLAGV